MMIYSPVMMLGPGDREVTPTYSVLTRGQALASKLYNYELFKSSQ